MPLQPPTAQYPVPQYGQAPQFAPPPPPVTYPAPLVYPVATGFVDPHTGELLSDKSKATAGLLQLFFGWWGIGRFYIGSTAIAVIQLALWIVAVLTSFFLIGFFIWAGLAIWAFIDAIMMFAGSVRDGNGRRLRG